MGTVVAGTVFVVVLFVVSCDLLGDNTDQNWGRYPILGALFGLKSKIWLSYFLEKKNYSWLVISLLASYHINDNYILGRKLLF